MKYSVIIPNYRDELINKIIDRTKLIDDAEVIVIESSKQVLLDKYKNNIKYKFFEKKMMPGEARNRSKYRKTSCVN